MTWALCLNCGDVKFGAICPCSGCGVESTGDMSLDIAFSDHHLGKETLEQFGAVVKAIHDVCDDDELCFWAFILYVSDNHPDILAAEIKPDLMQRVEQLLGGVALPVVTVREGQWDGLEDFDDEDDAN